MTSDGGHSGIQMMKQQPIVHQSTGGFYAPADPVEIMSQTAKGPSVTSSGGGYSPYNPRKDHGVYEMSAS